MEMNFRINEVDGVTEGDRRFMKHINHDKYVRITACEEGNKPGCLLPETFLDIAQRIRDMEVRETDIWVLSYPKSGTTWTQEMVWCICNDLDFESAKSTILPIRFPFLELSTFLTGKRGIPPLLKDSVSYVENMESPRFIKCHLPWELLPKQIKTVKPKIIYVARNPKDLCLSYYHQLVRQGLFKGNFEEMAELFLEDRVPYSPYWDHVLTYWEHRYDPNLLFIKYEDMKKDLPSICTRVASFLDEDCSDIGQLSELCSHLSFEAMKSNVSVNYTFWENTDIVSCLGDINRNFMRKGKVGSWKEEMSPHMAKRFDTWIERHLMTTDFSFYR
ncbi:luciferin sulfotransferase-like [Ischnura elegans]|uniref:luciferin sulfotransferase-like n=1 Tax=Ischnura elegans TaxID=197161 RepID=UPI001ED8BA7C|nr:luciferin sulfotransferase-like [Ischnura elegans]